ncbi:MAG TPA: hypothetical protein VGU61_08880 [Noviherbaspirillum sp.]|jgi:hypothetical protein|uniref:hypothetical protein n=1 Tax=Noviherbaspirillum sp. TaxID=1926288 RepID=UPI002DDD3BD8|nr:hypothetical protein [Noviherbaspirillum sp.]HEV2610366.1 hypothetical protein [Noviherbaspirillum sp.]
MSNKVEWELVDGSASRASQSAPHFLKALLGPWWKWKAGGAAIVTAAVLLLLATVAGIVMLGVVALALLSLAVHRVRVWLGSARRAGSSAGSSVQRR